MLSSVGSVKNQVNQTQYYSTYAHYKVRQGTDPTSIALWADFRQTAERFERQRVASESGMAFLFSEGALVDALRTGKW